MVTSDLGLQRSFKNAHKMHYDHIGDKGRYHTSLLPLEKHIRPQ